MTTEQTQFGKIIRNVATLDLRDATEQTIAGIKEIGNAATILYSAQNAQWVMGLKIHNVATMLEAPSGGNTVAGQETLTRDSFKNISEPLTMVVMGQLIIEPDIPAEELEAGLNSIFVAGQILCPDHLAGVINNKASHISGQLKTFPGDGQLIQGNLDLTESYLRALTDGTKLTVLGRIKATDVLDNDLLKQKVASLYVEGSAICREENAEALLAALNEKSAAGKLTIIPADFTLIDRPLVLDNDLLEVLPGNKLYCQDIRIEEDVDADLLEAQVESLIVNGTLICPSNLRATVGGKCNLLETEAIFYTGELWLVDNETTLLAGRFDYLEGTATLVVTGELMVAADIEPQVLASRLGKVHNLGEISATTAQIAAIQSRLGKKMGEFHDTTVEKTANNDDPNVIDNAAYLKL